MSLSENCAFGVLLRSRSSWEARLSRFFLSGTGKSQRVRAMAEKKVENFYHERNEVAAAVAFELWRGSSHFSYESVDESGSSHIFCNKKRLTRARNKQNI